MDRIIVFVMMIQRSVKNQLIVVLARLVPRSDFISTRNVKRAGHLFIPDAVAIAIDSRLSNLALILVLGVSSGYEIANNFFLILLFIIADIQLCCSVITISSVYIISMYFYILKASLAIFIKTPISTSQFFIHAIKIYSYIIVIKFKYIFKNLYSSIIKFTI